MPRTMPMLRGQEAVDQLKQQGTYDSLQQAMSAARYEALFRVSQAIGKQRDPKGLFCVLARELRHVIRFDGIGVGQYDEAAKRVQWHVSERCSQPFAPQEHPGQESLACWVYQNQKPITIPFLDRETRFPAMVEQLKRYGIQSACALPLTTVHRRVGIVVLASEHPDAYSEEEVSFLKVVADMVALAIDDALNFDASQRAQERLKHRVANTGRLSGNEHGLEVTEKVRVEQPAEFGDLAWIGGRIPHRRFTVATHREAQGRGSTGGSTPRASVASLAYLTALFVVLAAGHGARS